MKKFNQIVLLDINSLDEAERKRLSEFSERPLKWVEELPVGENREEKIVAAIGNSDAVLVSLLVELTKTVFERCGNLKYVGVFGSTMRKVDLAAAAERNVPVKNILEYCDFETAEYFAAQLLGFVKGIGGKRPARGVSSLSKRKLGIVGAGAVGEKFAQIAAGLEMEICYFSRSRKPEWEKRGFDFLPLEDLLSQSEVVFLSVPPDTKILNAANLNRLKEDAVVVSATIGDLVDDVAFRAQIDKTKRHFIFDSITGATFRDLAAHPNVTIAPQVAATCVETRARRASKLIVNVGRVLLPL